MWSLLFLLFSGIEATSNGVGITCDVDQPNLGSNQRDVKSNLTMWWTLPPQFAGNQYTLRTADPISAAGPRKISTSSAPTAAPNAGTNAPTQPTNPTTRAPTNGSPTKAPTPDPTTYLPNEWINIYVRTTNQDKQFNGLILYAVNSANQKVGNWQVPANAPYHVMESSPCVVHSNADPKNYLSVFKFQGPPVGTGTVTIKALVKFGLAFPSPTGMFFWPNSAHLQLTEAAPVSQGWFEGEVGESCITVCTKRGLGCNLAAMRSQGNSSTFVEKVSAFTNCTGPMLPGCSPASPSVGLAGCFYHSDTCIQPAPANAWVRNDICASLSAWGSGCCQNNVGCCSYQGAAWCCAYSAGSEAPNANNPYGPWGAKQKGGGMIGNCTPPGSLPAALMTVPLPARVNPGPSAITCEATKNSVQDGRRICACSTDGKYTADSATSLSVLTVVLLAPLFVSF